MWLREVISKSVNYKRRITINGQGFLAPRIYGMSTSATEAWMLPLLKQIRRARSGRFIDVGVNVGQTLLKVKSVDIAWDYLGLEPNPACVFYSRELARINNLNNVSIFPVGISEVTGVYDLFLFSNSSVGSAASLIEDFKGDTKPVQNMPIACFSFQDLPEAARLSEVSVLKIDVEGSEPAVLRSMAGKISGDRPFIFLEVLPAYSSENEARLVIQREIESFLSEQNYKLYRAIKTPNGQLEHLESVASIGVHSDLNRCDYISAHTDFTRLLEDLVQ